MSSEQTKVTEREGTVPFVYEGETYQTFFKVFGDLHDKERTPIIVPHGGPGLVHNYLLPFVDLSIKYGIPVILYDQIGNGRSTHLIHKPSTFWTIDLFIDELLNLVKHFSIQDRFDIAGHSWGGMLACELEVRRQPKGLRRLILSNTAADMGLRIESTTQLVEPFPDDVKQGLAVGFKDRKKHLQALKAFYAVHGCTVQPLPPDFEYTLDQVLGPEGDPTVPNSKCQLFSLCSFNQSACSRMDLVHFSRMISRWTIVNRLHLVRVPTLLINGCKDFVQDFTVQPYFDNIANVKWVTLQNSSHSPFYEERERYFKLISDFLS